MDQAHEEAPRAEATLPSAGRARQSLDALLALVRLDYGLAALIGMAIVGIGISIYLTTVHYAGVAPICSTTGVIDCARVTSSQWSVVPGTQLPITIPGMLWFLVSGALAVALLRARTRG
ncbi:MAG TPA: vitamin K epoxide reductase family protein, partial [Ktedonobacterales bacterium]